MNAKIETPEMMIYAMASQIENLDTVLHGVSILAFMKIPSHRRVYPDKVRIGPWRLL